MDNITVEAFVNIIHTGTMTIGMLCSLLFVVDSAGFGGEFMLQKVMMNFVLPFAALVMFVEFIMLVVT